MLLRVVLKDGKWFWKVLSQPPFFPGNVIIYVSRLKLYPLTLHNVETLLGNGLSVTKAVCRQRINLALKRLESYKVHQTNTHNESQSVTPMLFVLFQMNGHRKAFLTQLQFYQ